MLSKTVDYSEILFYLCICVNSNVALTDLTVTYVSAYNFFFAFWPNLKFYRPYRSVIYLFFFLLIIKPHEGDKTLQKLFEM